jgi:hypothetical protein
MKNGVKSRCVIYYNTLNGCHEHLYRNSRHWKKHLIRLISAIHLFKKIWIMIYDPEWMYITCQPRTQGFLLPRLDGQRKRPWLRLVCFGTWLVNDSECNYSIYVGIIIILVKREWSDKFIIIVLEELKYWANTIFDISLEIQHELGKENTSQNNLVQIKSLYILYRRVFASVQHTFLTCVVYTSLISRNVQRYSQIKIVIRI